MELNPSQRQHVPPLKNELANHPFILKTQQKYDKIIVIMPNSRGGDAELASNYAEIFNATVYHDANMLLSEKNYGKLLVIFFNLDRQSQAFRIIHLASLINCDTCIYTLHHPLDGIIAMNVSRLIDKNLLPRLLFQVPIRLLLLILKPIFLASKLLSAIMQGDFSRSIRCYNKILNSCTYILVSSPKEEKAIKDIVSSQDIIIFPHVISESPQLSPVASKAPFNHPSNPYVIIAGRSEYRKNLHATVPLIRRFPLVNFVVFTTYQENHGNLYQNRLIESFQDLSNCQLILNADSLMLYEHIKNSIALINPSWFEVNSMLDLYAIRSSIKLITTQYSWLDYRSSDIYFFDPFKSKSLLQTFSKAGIV
jgi:hypothetical protein